jgi:hypothetical protein
MRLFTAYCQKRGCSNLVRRAGFRFCYADNCGKSEESEEE